MKKDWLSFALWIGILLAVFFLCLGWTEAVQARVQHAPPRRNIDYVHVEFGPGYVHVTIDGDTRICPIPESAYVK